MASWAQRRAETGETIPAFLGAVGVAHSIERIGEISQSLLADSPRLRIRCIGHELEGGSEGVSGKRPLLALQEARPLL